MANNDQEQPQIQSRDIQNHQNHIRNKITHIIFDMDGVLIGL